MDSNVSHMLEQMSKQMHNEMKANEFKGDRYLDADFDLLEHELLYHVVKLLYVSRSRSGEAAIREYAADVANCAGMLAQKHGALSQTVEGNASSYEGVPSKDIRHAIADRMSALM